MIGRSAEPGTAPGRIGRWIDESEPEVPAAFRRHLNLEGPATPDGFAAAGSTAMRESLQSDARERRAAFRLLAADAYFTYACVRALEPGGEPDVLPAMVTRVAGLCRDD